MNKKSEFLCWFWNQWVMLKVIKVAINFLSYPAYNFCRILVSSTVFKSTLNSAFLANQIDDLRKPFFRLLTLFADLKVLRLTACKDHHVIHIFHIMIMIFACSNFSRSYWCPANRAIINRELTTFAWIIRLIIMYISIDCFCNADSRRLLSPQASEAKSEDPDCGINSTLALS